MTTAKLRVGEIYRDRETRVRFRIVSTDPGVVAENLDTHFPNDPVCSLSDEAMRSRLQPEAEASADDFEKYLSWLAAG
jgi:hypothetical protein